MTVLILSTGWLLLTIALILALGATERELDRVERERDRLWDLLYDSTDRRSS